MALSTLQIWDLFFKADELRVRVYRYSSDSPIKGAFNATEHTEGHQAVAGGLTYIRNFEQLRPDPMEENRVNSVGDSEYGRVAKRHEGRLSVNAMMPEGYTIPNLDGVFPQPATFKVFQGRLAFYWNVGPGLQQFYWKLEPCSSIESACEKLNRELLVRAGAPLKAEELQLEPREIAVLKYVRDQEDDEAPTQRMIARKVGEEEDTVGIVCRKLEKKLGLIHRPHGERKGYRLTQKGREFLDRSA